MFDQTSFGTRFGRCLITFGLPIFLLRVLWNWKDYGPFALLNALLEAVGGSFFLALIEHGITRVRHKDRQ